MTARHEIVPEDFLNHLRDVIPGFALESNTHQLALCRMIWVGHCKHRQHQHFAGAMSFGHRELERTFGRGEFTKLNKRLGIFRLSPNWSRDCGWTRGYWFTPAVYSERRQYLNRRILGDTKLLRADGSTLTAIPHAVAAKDMTGSTTTAWCSAEKLNRIAVNLDSLVLLQDQLREIQRPWCMDRGPVSFGLPPPVRAAIDRALDYTCQVIRLATTERIGHGYITQRYVQSQSGRLYACGINLQSAPSLVKEAALHGLWDYDFSNCHYGILYAMAEKFGYKCSAIKEYLETKKDTRMAIAQAAGITESQAKTCLIAIMYGARASAWHENSIPEIIGVTAAKRLFLIPQFNGLQRDIKKARTAILENWKRTANGRLTNAFGKAISGNATAAEKMAHLLQGVEAKALQTAVNLYPNDIVLLQHDGFTASAALNIPAIEGAVFQVTGYRLSLEVKLVQVQLHDYFLRHLGQTEFDFKFREMLMNSISYTTPVQVNSTSQINTFP